MLYSLLHTVLLLFAVVILCQAVTNDDYIKENDCMETDMCNYDYSGTMKLTNGERVDVSADVGLFCESSGLLNEEEVVRSCITVKNTAATLVHAAKTEERESKQYVPANAMKKWFCFAQSTVSGKILRVFYPKDEDPEIVNLKKSIVSAFQANYKGSSEVHETDTQSEHISHYRYTTQGDRQIQQRSVLKSNIKRFAGSKSKSHNDISFVQEDEIEIDRKKRIHLSKGAITIKLGKDKEQHEAAESDEEKLKDLPMDLGATSGYELRLSHCVKESDNDDNVRETIAAALSSDDDGVIDSLLARTDENKKELEDMKELNDDIPSVDETVSRVQRDVESKETGELLHKWRRLLEMESKHRPLPGTQAKLPQLIKRLQESEVGSTPSVERIFIYHLLSAEGSLEAQKELMKMLNEQLPEEERSNLLLDIALLSSVHVSTVDSLIAYYEGLDTTDDLINQCLLSISGLGHHTNVQDKVFTFIDNKLKATGKNDTSNIILLIHALGNTGSKRIVPILLPYLYDPQYQLVTVDALRTVTLEKEVQEGFITVVKGAVYPEQVMAVIETLSFPFKHSVYFPEEPDHYTVDQSLLDVLLVTAVRFHDTELNKSLKKYFSDIGDESLNKELLPVTSREKRASSSYWASSGSPRYNLIESLAKRRQDVRNYPYNRAYLWAARLGSSKVYADIGAGGFGGIGITGLKTIGKGKINIVVYGKKYTFLQAELLHVATLPDRNSIARIRYVRFVKIAGRTLINQRRTISRRIAYTKQWEVLRRIFRAKYSFFIYVGTLDLTIAGSVRADLSLNAGIANAKAKASITAGPTVIIAGGVSINLLRIYKIGMDVPCTLSYFLTPEASAGACSKVPKGDAAACFVVRTRRNGRIGIKAYWRKLETRCKYKWGVPYSCSVKWSGKHRVRALSKSWTLHASTKVLYGICRICECYGRHPLNRLCGGRPYGSSRCSCRTSRSG